MIWRRRECVQRLRFWTRTFDTDGDDFHALFVELAEDVALEIVEQVDVEGER
jgi:hypothetical protein